MDIFYLMFGQPKVLRTMSFSLLGLSLPLIKVMDWLKKNIIHLFEICIKLYNKLYKLYFNNIKNIIYLWIFSV